MTGKRLVGSSRRTKETGTFAPCFLFTVRNFFSVIINIFKRIQIRNLSISDVSGFIVLVILWEICRYIFKSPLMPSVYSVSVHLITNIGEMIPHIWESLKIITIGFFMAISFGFFVGILMARNQIIMRAILPITDFIRPVAAISLFPLFIIIFGLGLKSKVATIFWTAWPAALLNTIEGIAKVDKTMLEAAKMDGAGEFRLLKHIMIPLAMPVIMTGFRIAMSGGWISLVAAEMLGSNEGLGFYVLMKSQTFDFTGMYAGIIIIAVVGFIMNRALYEIQKLIEKEVSQ